MGAMPNFCNDYSSINMLNLAHNWGVAMARAHQKEQSLHSERGIRCRMQIGKICGKFWI
ncbi:hypothetical protein M378DRAFT_170889 [Amanita muscaria Koide BX008]|uniref:Uncharacterized protein n=1 Tax=Amanita muscaria (strain Koide BX008) TaxID=946122 RepID=A0A0C2S5Y9_AMAMK|nr:hypothetical protein M378DRAFT_170889 [Amanita muscaria Koide BX008]